jgi:hypothetical protein
MNNSRATHVAHGIRITGRKSKYSAWFCGDPTGRLSSLATIIDGERIDSRGRSYPLTAAEEEAILHGPWTARHFSAFNV